MTATRPLTDAPDVLLVLLLTAVVGVVVGVLVRLLLGRLARPIRLARGPCEVGVVVAWLPVAASVEAGVAAPAWAPLWLASGVLAVAGTATDLGARRLPDALTATAVPGVLACCLPLGPAAVGRAVLGALLLLVGYVLVALALPGSLGGGDVKLAGSMGMALGAAGWWALAAGPALAALGVLGTAIALHRRAVAYGPWALAATWSLVAVAATTLGAPP